MRNVFNIVAHAIVWYGTHAANEHPPARLPDDWLDTAMFPKL